jgi:hypothetical protein
MKKIISYVLFATVMLILLNSCQKGNTGPAGPAGPAGGTGSSGPTGATGTANVIYSDWFTPSAYTKDTVFGIYGFYFNETAPGITQPILDSGTVITFGKLDGYTSAIWPTNQVSALPIVVTYIEGTTIYNDTWSALVTPGNLKIQFVDDKNLYSGISNAHQFRYIIIPGGIKSNAIISKLQQYTPQENSEGVGGGKPDFSVLSYQQLCSLLNIPE